MHISHLLLTGKVFCVTRSEISYRTATVTCIRQAVIMQSSILEKRKKLWLHDPWTPAWQDRENHQVSWTVWIAASWLNFKTLRKKNTRVLNNLEVKGEFNDTIKGLNHYRWNIVNIKFFEIFVPWDQFNDII